MEMKRAESIRKAEPGKYGRNLVDYEVSQKVETRETGKAGR
jgi:hypothetical protein